MFGIPGKQVNHHSCRDPDRKALYKKATKACIGVKKAAVQAWNTPWMSPTSIH
jgi:hypothetical protein